MVTASGGGVTGHQMWRSQPTGHRQREVTAHRSPGSPPAEGGSQVRRQGHRQREVTAHRSPGSPEGGGHGPQVTRVTASGGRSRSTGHQGHHQREVTARNMCRHRSQNAGKVLSEPGLLSVSGSLQGLSGLYPVAKTQMPPTVTAIRATHRCFVPTARIFSPRVACST